MNSYIADDSKLMSEWNWEKNKDLDPKTLVYGSHEKAWWKCKKCGHEWPTEIRCRAKRHHGCSECARIKQAKSRKERMLKERGSLCQSHPDLVKEWDFDKNTIDPNSITASAKDKVWWKCKNGHSWPAKICNRARGNGCPQCYAATKTSFPEQAIYWYIMRIFKATNRDKTNDYEFDIYIKEHKVAIEYDGCYWHKNQHAKLMEKRKNDYCENNGIKLFRVKETQDKNHSASVSGNIITYFYDSTYKNLGDAIRLLLNCIAKHLHIAIDVEPNISSDRYNILLNYEQITRENSIARFPNLANEWDYENNGDLLPENVCPGSDVYIQWICPKGHHYPAQAKHRTKGVGCSICAGKTIVAGVNDLATLNPKLASEWHPTKNGNLKPDMVAVASGKRVWWLCPICSHVWKTSIQSRNSGKGCKRCATKALAQKQRLSHAEFMARFSEKGNKTLEILGEYANNSTKIEYKCLKCGRIDSMLPDGLLKGNGCSKCAKNHKKSEAEFLEKLHDIQPTIKVIGTFVNMTTNIEVECLECGYKWNPPPSNLLGHTGCPKCRKKQAADKLKRPVSQYSKEGILIKTYASARDAARELGLEGISFQHIHSACQGQKKSAYGYIWIYQGNEDAIRNLVAANRGIVYSKTESNRARKVAQLDKTGKTIAIYDSANAAGRALGKQNGGNIADCCRGKAASAYGYRWKYLTD